MEDLQDLFISHAGLDKEEYILPLTGFLSQKGVTFWLDCLEIAWGDSISLELNRGLRTCRFVLLCLSRNFLARRWPEAEMNAALCIQNETGVKRVLPLILNSKDEVLHRYPLLSGLAYREFDVGSAAIVDELSGMLGSPADIKGQVHVIVESVHTGRICNLLVDPRVSVRWLRDRAQAGMGLSELANTGAYVPFRVRWILVDVGAEKIWRDLPRSEKRELRAVVLTEEGPKFSLDDRDHLLDLGVKSGTTFHMYAVEDDEWEEPAGEWSTWR